jgi:sensor histidine kinase regulating citrate/malate metabolism
VVHVLTLGRARREGKGDRPDTIAAVREIVHEAGASIDVEGEPGPGTAFEIQLPRARPA